MNAIQYTNMHFFLDKCLRLETLAPKMYMCLTFLFKFPHVETYLCYKLELLLSLCISQQENVSFSRLINNSYKYIQNFMINFAEFHFECSNSAAHMYIHIYEYNNLQINCYICLISEFYFVLFCHLMSNSFPVSQFHWGRMERQWFF